MIVHNKLSDVDQGPSPAEDVMAAQQKPKPTHAIEEPLPPPPPSPDLNSDWSLLLNRRTATWNLFVKQNQHITKQVAVEISVNKT